MVLRRSVKIADCRLYCAVIGQTRDLPIARFDVVFVSVGGDSTLTHHR
jgi:hypothetical protein